AESMSAMLLDKDSKGGFEHAASYMYKDLPETAAADDDARIAELLHEMDGHGVEQGLIPISFQDLGSLRAVREHPDRLLGSYLVDPNRGMDGVADLVRAVEEAGVIAA